MRHHSVRGVGIRYLLAMTLPVSGIALVIYTVVQLVMAQHRGVPPAPRRFERAALAGAPTPLPAPSRLIGDAPLPETSAASDDPASGGAPARK